MKTSFYRSLDRPINIFGLRGRWVTLFLYSLGGCLVLAFIIGIMMGVGMGFSVFIVGGVAAFFGCLVLQAKTPARRLEKVKVSSRLRRAVYRRETLTRIIPQDPMREREKKN